MMVMVMLEKVPSTITPTFESFPGQLATNTNQHKLMIIKILNFAPYIVVATIIIELLEAIFE